MAKQSFSIEDIQKELRSINPFGNTLDKSESASTTEWYGTGNYHLNAALAADLFKGIPNNRSICISGDSGAGKSYFALNLCAEAQKKGAYIIYYDTEGAIESESVKSFGIELSRFDHQPVSDLNTFRTSITTLTKKLMEAKAAGGKIPKLFIVLDSLGMLATKKEVDDAISGNTAADMTRAKMIRSLFRIITSDLSSLGIPLVYTNHTYACLTGDTLIKVNDTDCVEVSELKKGDNVLTLNGLQEIEDIFEYEDSKYLEIELEDGKIIKCTPNHKFLIGDDINNEDHWIEAINLVEGTEILKL